MLEINTIVSNWLSAQGCAGTGGMATYLTVVKGDSD
jgi:hypothetical protein